MAEITLIDAVASEQVIAGCERNVTFNVRHYQPGHPNVSVLGPGEFVSRVRNLLTHLELDNL
jgi:hypothetical protein